MNIRVRKPTMLFMNRSDTNRAVQAQKMARRGNFRFRMRRNCTICVVKKKALFIYMDIKI